MKSTQRWKEQQPVIQALDRNVQRVISVQPPSQNFLNLSAMIANVSSPVHAGTNCLYLPNSMSQTTGEARGGVRPGLIAKLMQGCCFLFLHKKGWKTGGAEIGTRRWQQHAWNEAELQTHTEAGCDADDSQSKHDTAGLKVLNSVCVFVYLIQCSICYHGINRSS